MTLDPSHPSIRWVILFLSCWLLFGNYYAFDNPSALNLQLMDWLGSDYETWQFRLSFMYSVYSFPNLFLPLLTGALLDRWGVHRLLILFSALVGIGQGIFALGVQTRTFGVMLLGRVIFGLGGESLTVAQCRLVTDWFRGRELALAIGLNLSIARFGTVFNNNLSPYFAQKLGIPFSIWIGFISCVWSFICAIFTVVIDKRCQRHDALKALEDATVGHPVVSSSSTSCVPPVKPMGLWETVKSTVFIVQSYHPAFWLVCVVCFTYYGAIVPFNNIAADVLRSKWYGDDTFKTGLVMSIPDTVAIFLVPLVGSFVDHLGHRVTVMTLGGLLMALGHFLLGTTTLSPIFPLSLNGIANSTLLAIWPCVPLLVPERYWASAYGFITVCVNASYTFVPLGVAALVSRDPSFYSVEMYLMSLTLFGMFISLVLARMNANKRLGLNDGEGHGGAHELLLEHREDELGLAATLTSGASKKSPRVPTFAAPFEPLLVIQDIPRPDYVMDMGTAIDRSILLDRRSARGSPLRSTITIDSVSVSVSGSGGSGSSSGNGGTMGHDSHAAYHRVRGNTIAHSYYSSISPSMSPTKSVHDEMTTSTLNTSVANKVPFDSEESMAAVASSLMQHEA